MREPGQRLGHAIERSEHQDFIPSPAFSHCASSAAATSAWLLAVTPRASNAACNSAAGRLRVDGRVVTAQSGRTS